MAKLTAKKPKVVEYVLELTKEELKVLHEAMGRHGGSRISYNLYVLIDRELAK
jgi:hypothetical protein